MAGNTQRSSNTPSAKKRPAQKKPVRKKRSKKNTYLCAAVALAVVAVALLIGIIMSVTSCDSDTSEDSSLQENQSSQQPDVSEAVSTDISEESDISDISHESDVTPEMTSTEKYEEYIGIEYAVDMTEYEEYVCPENPDRFVFLVNPSHPLASDFVPEDLVWCTSIREGRPEKWSYMDATANKALEAFLAEAAHYGFDDITVTNAYRSYSSQASLFSGYVSSDLKEDYYCDTCNEYIDYSYEKHLVDNGYCALCQTELRRPTEEETTAHVLTYSTRPGTSEHQSGLCCDMHNLPSTSSAFDDTPEAIWLAENAHRFGFILRYPKNTQHITGIKHESWHFRFVGREAATEIYLAGITLDEYLAD